LVEKAKSNPLAFGELYDHYYVKISNYVLRRVGSMPISQDITSEVFFKAMKSLPKFEWREVSFSSWLYKIATNETYTYFRRKGNKPLSLDVLFEKYNFEIEDTTSIEDEYVRAEEIKKRQGEFIEIQKHLRMLALKYQEILILRFFERKKLIEISQITGKNLNTVKTLLSRGLESLRESYYAQERGDK
jgi:RNA polymerase sigma-70 factor (ECF subfamily)